MVPLNRPYLTHAGLKNLGEVIESGWWTTGSQVEALEEEFAEYIMSDVNGYARKWIIEDSNAQFNDKYGAIAMVCAVYNGWELEPHVNFFSWATPRNKLRAMVSFLQMMRYDKEVGIVNANSLEETKNFFHHVVKYGVLKYAAKVPNGDSRGDRYMFYIRGRKDAGH